MREKEVSVMGIRKLLGAHESEALCLVAGCPQTSSASQVYVRPQRGLRVLDCFSSECAES